ncbi:MAG: Wzz/FepE/Etk N-terminal domain-containing protein [Gammaproteobacteria bacterium]
MRSRRNLPVLAVAAAPVVSYEASIPRDYAHPGLSLMQIGAIVWAYRKHAIIIAVSIIIVSGIVIKLLHRTYTATATLMVNYPQRDPLDNAQGQAPPMSSFMATEIQLMQSPEVLLPVVDELKLTGDAAYAAGYRSDGGTLREWVKEKLIKDIDIEAGPAGSQLIYVNASARFPYLAARLANTISDVYLAQERDRVSGPASERAKRYAAELAELKNKVRVAQDQVTAFRQRTGVTDSAARNNNIDADLLASLETRLQEAQNARRAAEVRAAAEQTVGSGGAVVSPTIQALKLQIGTEQASLAQLRATLGAKHPKVMELENQLAANRRNMAEELRTMTTGASSDLIAARQLESKLQAAVADQRAKTLTVSRLQDEGTKYVLELESAQNVYKRALDGYDQIMFASDGHYTNISMVSRAADPQNASKPNKIKLLLLGAFVGILAGLAAPIGYELLLNRRVRCRDDFERDLAVPVLIEFDAVSAAGAAA